MNNFSTSAIHRARYERFGSRKSSSNSEFEESGAFPKFARIRWDTATKVASAVVVSGGVYYLFHLEKIPETGRWRFMDISASTEQNLAKTSHEQLLDEFHDKILPPNHPVTRYVRNIVQNVLSGSSLGTVVDSSESTSFLDPRSQMSFEAQNPQSQPVQTTQWRLLVVNDPKIVNAMATWGSIVVFTGILPVTETADGLAAVLGHEIAHATLSHPSERLSSMKVLTALGILLNVLGLDMGLSQWLTTLALELPNGRNQELEADKVGMIYAAKACFDPRAAVQVQTRLDALEKQQSAKSFNIDLGFLRTHPRGEYRVKLLEASLPDAFAARASSPSCAALADSYDGFRDTIRRSGSEVVWS